jgi:hypothetical protein
MPTATPTAGGPGASGHFSRQDTETGGDWKGVYGKQGFVIEGDSQRLPTFARVNVGTSQTFTWASSTSDPRALQRAASATDGIAAAWFDASGFKIDVNLTDGKTHRISLYSVDWDIRNRSQRYDVLDNRGAVLDSRTLNRFSDGAYLSWIVSGHVQFRITRTAGPNAVVSGIFIDDPGIPVAATSTPTAVPTNTPVAEATDSPTPSPTSVPTRAATHTPTATATPTREPGQTSYRSHANVAPAVVVSSRTATVMADVTSMVSSTALVDVEVYDAMGRKVFQQFWDNQTFTANQTRTYQANWSVPITVAPGPYTIKVGVFKPGWKARYYWNNSAGSFTVA